MATKKELYVLLIGSWLVVGQAVFFVTEVMTIK